MSYIETLKKAEYFKWLTDNDLKFVDRICHEEEFDAGDFIFHEGDEAKNLYVVKEGKVAICMEEGLSKPVTVCVVPEGGGFGWSTLVKPNKFVGGAKCLEKSHIIVIDGAEMYQLCQANVRICGAVMGNIAQLVSSRLRDARRRLLDCRQSE